ncbi:MAG: DUF2520 domain-containing protein [Thermoanaerobaculia bacterium]
MADSTPDPRILGIIGGGRAAWAFGSHWPREQLGGIALRAESKSHLPEMLGTSRKTIPELTGRSEIVLVAVSDDAVPTVAAEVARVAAPEQILFHASGSLTSDVFAGHARAFSLHPLRSLPPPGVPFDFSGTLFVFEGPLETEAGAKGLVERFGGRMLRIEKQQKALYHAAAVYAANFTGAMLEICSELLEEAGLPREELTPDVARLAESAIANWSGSAAGKGFTGPAIRGDASVVERHIEVLAADPGKREIYRLVSMEILRSAIATGDHLELQKLLDRLETRG